MEPQTLAIPLGQSPLRRAIVAHVRGSMPAEALHSILRGYVRAVRREGIGLGVIVTEIVETIEGIPSVAAASRAVVLRRVILWGVDAWFEARDVAPRDDVGTANALPMGVSNR
jgi:hypothetical protein